MNMDSLLALMEDPNLLPPVQLDLLRKVAELAVHPTYIVGGFTRDLLLGKQVSDFDVVMEVDAISFAHKLAKRYGGKITAHAKFGTAKWYRNDGSFLDLITARSETYLHNAALPAVKFAGLTEDLLRRDFTINTLAVRIDGSHFGDLCDDPNGRKDLENGVVRVLHENSFLDDPTRMFRAVRYEQRYDFKIEPKTLSLIAAAHQVVERLSAQRIRHELDLILEERQAESMVARLAELGLLRVIHPDLPSQFSQIAMLYQKNTEFSGLQAIASRSGNENLFAPTREFMWLLWLATLPIQKIESINSRLRFGANLLKMLKSASELLKIAPRLSNSRPSQWVKQLDAFPSLSIAAVFVLSEETKIKSALLMYLHTWSQIKPFTTGADLIKRGLPAGPKYKETLWNLRAAWLDGGLTNQTQEDKLLTELLERK